MRKLLKFTIAEPSDILFAGLASVLEQINAGFRIFRIRDLSQLKGHLQMEQPDVLFVNPMLPGLEPIDRLRDGISRADLICVAFVSDLQAMHQAQDFDARVTLYDSFEQIREKLSALSPKEKEEEGEKSLSQREKEIITYVVKGYTNKQIAEELCLSQHTVITHRRNIASKLQIHSSAGLTIYAIVNKLVKLEDIKEDMKGD